MRNVSDIYDEHAKANDPIPGAKVIAEEDRNLAVITRVFHAKCREIKAKLSSPIWGWARRRRVRGGRVGLRRGRERGQ